MRELDQSLGQQPKVLTKPYVLLTIMRVGTPLRNHVYELKDEDQQDLPINTRK